MSTHSPWRGELLRVSSAVFSEAGMAAMSASNRIESSDVFLMSISFAKFVDDGVGIVHATAPRAACDLLKRGPEARVGGEIGIGGEVGPGSSSGERRGIDHV